VNKGGDCVSRLDTNFSWRDAGPEEAESNEGSEKEKDRKVIVYTFCDRQVINLND
jgi:hypothetical protein